MTKFSAVAKQAVGEGVQHHGGSEAGVMIEEVTVYFVSVVSEPTWVLGGTHWTNWGCLPAVPLGKSRAGVSWLVPLPGLP